MEQVTLWSHETVLTAEAGSAAKARNFVVHQLVDTDCCTWWTMSGW